jgi:phytoene/squalene synthetase
MILQRPNISYYSFRQLDFKRYQALAAIYNCFTELQKISDKSSEPMVTRQTLQLWQQDLAAAYVDAAQLPATKALQQALQDYTLPEKYWQDIITAVEMDIDHVLYFNNDDLQRYAEKKRGSLLQLYAAVLAPDTDENLLQQAGVFIERVQIMQKLGENAANARYIPEQTRNQNQCELWHLQQRDAKALPCLRSFINDTQIPTLDKLPKSAGAICNMTMIYSELLKLLAKDPLKALQQEVDLSPLAKLFYSYYYRFRC